MPRRSTSFIAKDKPTIDALNEAGLDVSSVGNHEFDQGYDDLIDRVMAPYDAATNPWAVPTGSTSRANVKTRRPTSPTQLAPTWINDLSSGVQGRLRRCGDRGSSLAGLAGRHRRASRSPTSCDEVNEEADDLKADGADIIVMLVHEGAGDHRLREDAATRRARSARSSHGVNDNIDAIVSGHTHLEYNCSFPVAGWAGRDVTERPVVSAGQYGTALEPDRVRGRPGRRRGRWRKAQAVAAR